MSSALPQIMPKAVPLLRFLLLEAHRADAERLTATLRSGGIDCDLRRVETRSDFVTALKTDRFDLVLAADGLPGLGGIEALNTVLSLGPKTPVILVSGSPDENLEIAALQQGATDYVLKQRLGRLVPSVQRALRSALEQRECQAALRDRQAALSERQTALRERQQTEQHRDRFLAVGSDLQVIVGGNGYFQWVSPTFERTIGWTVEQILTRPWMEFVHPDDRPASIAEIDCLFTRSEPFGFENRCRHQDGSYRWLLWNVQPYPDEQVIYGTAVDITDRKHVEVALRSSEAQFRNMADHAPFMIWVTDPTGACTYLSQSWYDLTGQTPSTGLGFGWLSRIHPDDCQQTERVFREANQQQEGFRLEYRVQCQDGEYVWVIDAASPWFGAEGQFNGYVGSVIDITDRKQAEAALQKQTQLLQLIVDSVGDGLILANSQGEFVRVNQAAERIFGSLTNERSWDQWSKTYGLFLPDQQTLFPDEQLPLYRAIQGEHASDVEVFVRRDPAAEGRWISISGFPVRDGDSQITGGVITCRDITDHKQFLHREQAARAAAERANRLKDEFLAVLSHELRSPLNPILGWSRLLQTGTLDRARQAEALATIERNAKLQSQLIEDLLDLSRIMQGKLSLTPAPVSLTFVIFAAVDTVQLAAEAKAIQITFDLDFTLPPISGDAARLQQVFWNLLTNAVKFTPHGGQVRVELQQIDQVAQICIIDTGRGIDPQFLPHVFEYFRQEDGSTTRQFGGLGLGLAIVRQIVEMHGGTVTAESAGENQGATFRVQLPMLLQTPPSLPETACPFIPMELPLAQVQVLLVDDDADTREFQAFLLEQSGARVIAVASGTAALQALNQCLPDLLISDIGMTDMNGYGLIQQIRSRTPDQGGTVPAIALTAYAAEVDRQRAIQAGFQIHLTKPVQPEDLVAAIVDLLGD